MDIVLTTYCKSSHRHFQVTSIGGMGGVKFVLHETMLNFSLKKVHITSGKECHSCCICMSLHKSLMRLQGRQDYMSIFFQ